MAGTLWWEFYFVEVCTFIKDLERMYTARSYQHELQGKRKCSARRFHYSGGRGLECYKASVVDTRLSRAT